MRYDRLDKNPRCKNADTGCGYLYGSREYEKAIDILQQAYEYATMGRRIVYRLTELALKADSYE